MTKNMNSVSIPTQRFKFDKIYYGGDYTPEHWPPEVMAEDMGLMKKAGVSMVTINVFSWGQIQPDEDVWEFDWLDNIMNTLAENGIYADLGTATASTPAWMARKYPEILPIDENGIRFNHGSRQTFNKGRAFYLNEFEFTPENNRMLLRGIFWASGKEDEMFNWYGTNVNTEVAAFPETGNVIIINSSNEKQKTRLHKDINTFIEIELGPNESRWFSMDTL